MVLKLENIVPWGRSMEEYVSMFNLTNEDLDSKILDCASGPASFNAEMTALGKKVISLDPIYKFSAGEIHSRICEVYPAMVQGVRDDLESYIWSKYKSPEYLGRLRMETMKKFLEDFPSGLLEKRYLSIEMPILPFKDKQFDLAVCSHLLFSYSQQLSEKFHIQSILEMCRVATEIRIFPILDISDVISPHFLPVISFLKNREYNFEIIQSSYEFQRGGDRVMRIQSPVHASSL